MAGNTNNAKKLTLVPLVLMIFTSVFGFANMPRAFFLMGYAAIPWYLLSAILFFIPYAFMMAEYGSAFKKESGGMYSWMEKSVGPKYAFVGTFMWYASYIVWMVNVASTLWVPLSNAIFGYDATASWSLFGLTSVQTLGILGALWIILVTYVSTKGIEKITKVTSVGGTAVALLNIVLLVGGVLVVIMNKGQFEEPVTNVVKAFTTSPNPAYQTPLTVLSFLTFAIFAFGGLEVLGGLVDQTENAEKTFPKGLTLAAIVISVGYTIGIFACGMFTNWSEVLSGQNVNMANVAYVLMQNLGYQLGMAFGASQSVALTMGAWVARFVGLSMFLALSGAFFTLTYSPLKTLIEGAPKQVWPGKLGEIKDGMPINAMKVQAIIVVAMILLVSFGGKSASEFFALLVLMTNVAMTIPYLFLSSAFPAFKKKQLEGKVDKAFVVYKSVGMATTFAVIIGILVGFANVFTIIEPSLSSPAGLSKTLTMIAGPVLFGVIGFFLYSRYEKKHVKNSDNNRKAS
ncbi:MAG: glutamate/gamma-aminobutyrate family transporter YjeM [Paraclostridium bifermentans]|jgi:amino acid transporter|uniref:glutamate/gamma-aminobutyrate family transporter YjeM n=1 Tax=Paraclostridium bifermentans TaxID=1490 RepID=UPI000DF7A8D2|nr:glutamate/gamma-aminobutyrate family transporter YjeM [Paraclostridium bifermentans]RDC49898.1 glutamate/gamma-aminobutyrate family transporter YjeM [Acinetobacter sp. RIT592]MBS5954625.1 glutamate/gamma-aminobutyrate family transporter YjeM [Paraclostridium bifermentans]MBS6509486.1 glutamate/gamma-aminobutyrate family transporter YjeM [Paraclostridium bifermentans]MBU5288207.1 glutamate/gamma-aminobutyrate family transporter YjeM [Paraclostridium bifermentans]MDU3337826.1 glutamate/gamma-